MAFGAYGGARASEEKLVAAATDVVETETKEDVLNVISQHGGKIGYTPLSYMIRLHAQGEDDPYALAVTVQEGWQRGESPFSSVAAKVSHDDVVVAEPATKTKEEIYLESLI